MASEFADPPAPQTDLITTTGSNKPARVGPYTDRSLTKRNATGTAVSDQPAAPTPKIKSVRPVYAVDKQTEIDTVAAATANAAVEPAVQAGNSWKIETDDQGISRSRDFYRNNGVTGEPHLLNGGGAGG